MSTVRSTTEPKRVVNAALTTAINTFRERIRHGPTLVCTVCHRTEFPNQVKPCNRGKYLKDRRLAASCLTGLYVHVTCSSSCSVPCTVPQERLCEWICHTCDHHLSRGKMPDIAVANNMALAPIPPQLAGCNVLERQLISKVLPFSKIVALPKGRQRAIHGAVVCVPSEVETIVNALPRPSAEAQLLQVKLKRKIKYKGHQYFYKVDMRNVLAGLRTLKESHPEYVDVTIDENATFDDVLDDEPGDDALIEAIVDMEEKEAAAEDPKQQPDEEKEELRPGLALDTCMQPPDIAQEVLSYGEGIFSVAPAQGNRPVGFFSVPKLEAMAFPVQFPTGENTLDQDRAVKLSPSRYFNTRLLCVDTRFAQDQSYLFFAQFVTETHMANNSMSIQMRKGKRTKRGTAVTNKMLQDKEELEKLIQRKDATRFMQPLRGTPAYWEKSLRDLHAMVRQLGKPTFFITFSAAEMRWPEVIEAVKAQQGQQVDFSTLDWNEKCDILRSNPVTVMRMFSKRVDALMTDLILSPAEVIGAVEDFYYRVEFQARGSPHIHMLVWIKDAPEDPESSNTIKFIDRYISCQMPNFEADPELHRIVSEVQVHSRNHSKSCRRGNVLCRFGFPKLPMSETIITTEKCTGLDDEASEDDEDQRKPIGKKLEAKTAAKKRKDILRENQLEAREKLKPIRDLLMDAKASFEDLSSLLAKCKMTREEYLGYVDSLSTGMVVMMKRGPKDCWVNGYNPDLLRAWNANMDIQYVLDEYSCIMYMMSYVTKPEHEMTEFLNMVFEEVRTKKITSHVNERDQMRQIMQAYSKHREVSAQEAVARVCSLPLKKCSRSVVFLQTDEDGVRMSLPMSRLRDLPDGEEDVWMCGLPIKYLHRPATPLFDNMCLAIFASQFRVVYGLQVDGANVLALQNDMGSIQKRTIGKPAIIRFPRFSEKKHPEKFYRRLLKLYYPHRSDEELRTEAYPTYEEFYKRPTVKINVDFIKKLYEGGGVTVEKALEQLSRCGPILNAWNTFPAEAELDRLECKDQRKPIDEDDEDEEPLPDFEVAARNDAGAPAIEVPKLSPDFVRAMYRSLNETQASIFYSIREWCMQRVWGLDPEPFYYFVSGGAGCGKSHVIKCIFQEATKILRDLPRFRDEADMSMPAVLLTAFTGTAAFNISGKTLHSMFKLPMKLKPPYQGLGNTLDNVRASLSNAEILIIDEISMISKEIFAYVHWRLQQIKGNKRPFGGMSVLAVGDFYQLPPLSRAKSLCVCENDVLDLWAPFQMITLTEIMRQRDDRSFAELLNRLRTKSKTEPLDSDDKAMLAPAIVGIEDCPADVLYIFGTNKEVNLHNAATVAALRLQVVNIEAVDYRKDPRTGEMIQMAAFKGTKRDLMDNIQAAVGARVMVTRNIDVEDGVVNGTFGTIRNIAMSLKDPTHVKFIGLDLDNPVAGQRFQKKILGPTDRLVYIEKIEEPMSKRGVVRRQFPLKLAFGCTVHKVQGMTVTSAVVSLKNIFEPGMSYVALSRTTSLQSLRITHFEEKKIYADPNITTAMARMTCASFQFSRPLLHFLNSPVNMGSTLIVVHHNTQGLPSHIEDIKCHHELRISDILCITESHLSGSSVSPAFNLEGYDMFARNRNVSYANRPDIATKDGGGVVMYYKSSLEAGPRRYIQNVPDLEFAVLKVERPVTALIATVYRPPDYPLNMFLANMQLLLDSLDLMGCQPIVVCGDFNEDLLSGGKKAIKEMFVSRGYSQLVSGPTTEKQTLIDHIYISRPESCVQSGVLHTYYSYHQPVYCILT